MFSGLSRLVVEEVADGGDSVVVMARTQDGAVPCPACGTPTAKVHGYHGRTVKDLPVDGRPVVVYLQVRRLVCGVLGCRRQTFREQIPGLLGRHQRRTVRLTAQISQVARELCGRAAARLAGLLAMPVSRSTALRYLKRLPLPGQAIPTAIGVDASPCGSAIGDSWAEAWAEQPAGSRPGGESIRFAPADRAAVSPAGTRPSCVLVERTCLLGELHDGHPMARRCPGITDSPLDWTPSATALAASPGSVPDLV